MTEGYPEYLSPDSRASKALVASQVVGNMKGLYPNRISFLLDLKGPSMIVDTACSASLTAFNVAMNDLRLGINYKLA